MNVVGLSLIAAAIIGYGLVSGRLQRSVITPPMAFVLFGLVLGPMGLNLFHFALEGEFIRLLAEVTLVIILFCDAARIRFASLRSSYQIPARMLGIGMPLTVIFGALVGWLLFGEFGFWGAALLAAILTPTDAALGQAVVTNERVPTRMRQAINVESGLNDGLALPIVLFLIDMNLMQPSMNSASFWVGFVFQQILLGVAIGVVVAYVGGQLMERASKSGAMNHVFQEISSIALALCCYAVAEIFGGNGFIAAFIGGLTLGNSASSVCACLFEFAEAEGELFSLLTFMAFGSGMVIFAIQQPDLNWPVVILYSLLSLTVIRMIPIAISLIGMKLRWDSHLYLGWFGPRGIASILFGLIVVEQSGIAFAEEIFAIAMITVLLSIFLHGFTAWSFSTLYAARLERASNTETMPESLEVELLFPLEASSD